MLEGKLHEHAITASVLALLVFLPLARLLPGGARPPPARRPELQQVLPVRQHQLRRQRHLSFLEVSLLEPAGGLALSPVAPEQRSSTRQRPGEMR